MTMSQGGDKDAEQLGYLVRRDFLGFGGKSNAEKFFLY